jgi:fatty-acyl-CoA synthase
VLVVTPDATRDADAIRAALRERLAAFKVPRRFEFADALPRTATGKIRKPDLRDQYANPKENDS